MKPGNGGSSGGHGITGMTGKSSDGISAVIVGGGGRSGSSGNGIAVGTILIVGKVISIPKSICVISI
jgi:hypothetical protein